MVSERMLRRLEALLDEADTAVERHEWATVGEAARAALTIVGDNADALTFLRMAEANLGYAPSAPVGTPTTAAPVDAERGAELAAAAERSGNPLDRLEEGVFVGRAHELERLRTAFDAAAAGRGAVVMLVGEPGIGKTRTTQELEAYARTCGAQVLWGRTHETGGAPPYFPWRLIAQSYRAQNADEVRRKEWEPYAAELQRIFPALRDLFPHLPEPPAVDSQEGQFRLFEAMSGFLRDVSRRVPLLLVLDDLHWADRPTLQLLAHFAQDLGHARVFVLGTYRDTDLGRTHPLSQTLAELNRGQLFSRIALRGLSREETGSYIRAVAHVEPGAALVQRIHEDTEGNPFFLAEVVNLMTQEGTLARAASAAVSDLAIPEGVKEALGRRLDRLSPEANELLQLAAVVGREFDHALLVALTGHDDEAVLRLEEEALAGRVIEEFGAVGGYRFTHGLMQETLVAELSAARQVRLHGQIAEVMERVHGERADANAVTLAAHYAESAILNRAHALRAVHYLVRAGADAEAQFAWAEAVKHYERAVALMDESEDVEFADDAADVLASLGRCASFTDQFRDAWRATMRALDLYRARGNWAAFTGPLSTMNGNWVAPQRFQVLGQEALDGIGDRDLPARARLLGALLGFAPRGGVIDPWGEELAALSGIVSVPETESALRRWELAGLLNRGEFAAYLAAAEEASNPEAIPAFSGLQAALLLGDLSEAESWSLRGISAAQGRRLELDNATMWRGGLLLLSARFDEYDDLDSRVGPAVSYFWNRNRIFRAMLAGDTARMLTLLPPLEMAGNVPGNVLNVRGLRGAVMVRAGRESEAHEEWSSAAALVPQFIDQTYPMVRLLGLLEDAGPALDDGTLATWVRDRLLHATDGWRDIKAAPSSPHCVARLLALWAFSLGDVEDAERRYRAALEWCQREGCPIEEGRCWQGLAEIAERRGEHLDVLAHLDRAGELFAQHGAKFFLDQVIAKKEILKA